VTFTGETPPTIYASVTEISPLIIAAYWTGWTGKSANLAQNFSDVDILYLSFANFDETSGRIDTTVSGGFADIPAPGQWVPSSYANWTTFKN
jgi:hypothetical protein